MGISHKASESAPYALHRTALLPHTPCLASLDCLATLNGSQSGTSTFGFSKVQGTLDCLYKCRPGSNADSSGGRTSGMWSFQYLRCASAERRTQRYAADSPVLHPLGLPRPMIRDVSFETTTSSHPLQSSWLIPLCLRLLLELSNQAQDQPQEVSSPLGAAPLVQLYTCLLTRLRRISLLNAELPSGSSASAAITCR